MPSSRQPHADLRRPALPVLPVLPWVVLLLLAPWPVAAEVYRSVDEHGHVTFSDVPPADAVESVPVEIAPGPSAEQVQASQARIDARREQLEALQSARAAAAEQARLARRQQLEEAALRAAIQAPSSETHPPEDARRRFFGLPLVPFHPGFHDEFRHPFRPHPRAPLQPPLVPTPTAERPRVLDSPLFQDRSSLLDGPLFDDRSRSRSRR
jgi:hypothetical protein